MSYHKENSLKYAAYKAAQYNVSKTRQVVLLYDGAINYIKKAIQAIQEKNIQERYNNIDNACKILLGLQSSLDFDNGGDIAKILDEYYHSMDMRLIKVQRNNNIEDLEQISKEIYMMRDAWDEVDQMSSKGHENIDDITNNNEFDEKKPTSGSLSVDI